MAPWGTDAEPARARFGRRDDEERARAVDAAAGLTSRDPRHGAHAGEERAPPPLVRDATAVRRRVAGDRAVPDDQVAARVVDGVAGVTRVPARLDSDAVRRPGDV